jgi:hypothetical protein
VKHLNRCEECVAEPLCGFCADEGNTKCASVNSDGGNSFGCVNWVFQLSHTKGGQCSQPQPIEPQVNGTASTPPPSPAPQKHTPVTWRELPPVASLRKWSLRQETAENPRENPVQLPDMIVQHLAESEREEEIALRAAMPKPENRTTEIQFEPPEGPDASVIHQEIIDRNALEQRERVARVNDLSALDRQHKMDVLDREPGTLTRGVSVEDASIVAENDARLARAVTGVARKDTYVRPKSDAMSSLVGKAAEPKPPPGRLDMMRAEIDEFNNKEGYESSASYLSRMPGHWMSSPTGAAMTAARAAAVAESGPSMAVAAPQMTGDSMDSQLVAWHHGKTVHYQRLHEIMRTLRQLRELHNRNSPKIYALARGSAAGVIPDGGGSSSAEHVETYEEQRDSLEEELAQIIAYGNHHNPSAMAVVVQEVILEGKLDGEDKYAIVEHLKALSSEEPHGDVPTGGSGKLMGDLIDDAISILQAGGPLPQKDIARYEKGIGATPEAGSGRARLEKSGVVMRDELDGSGPGPLHAAHSAEENGINQDLSSLEAVLSGDGHVAATPQSPFNVHALVGHGGGTRQKANNELDFEWDDQKKVLKSKRPPLPAPKPVTPMMKWDTMIRSRTSELSQAFAKPLSDAVAGKTPREQHEEALALSGSATGAGSVNNR